MAGGVAVFLLHLAVWLVASAVAFTNSRQGVSRLRTHQIQGSFSGSDWLELLGVSQAEERGHRRVSIYR